MIPLPSKPARGFSLTEVLIVLAIFVVLIVIAFPATRRLRQSMQITGCISNLRQLAVAIGASSTDLQGRWPYYRDPVDASTYSGARNALGKKALSVGRDVAPYVQSYDVFFCPADKGFKQTYGKRDFATQDAYSSYVTRGRRTTGSSANMLSRQLAGVGSHAILSCYFLGIPGNRSHKISHHHDRWPVLFGDGHVVIIPMPDWITPDDYPKLNDAPTPQIKLWRYFETHR